MAPKTRVPLATGMPERRRRFVEAYMGAAAGNATEAARLAGYSPKTAYAQGSRLLKDAEVQAAIAERQQSDPLVLTREQALQRLSLIGSGRGVVPVLIDDIPAKVPDSDEDLMHPAKVGDQIKALDLLAKICGWTREDDNGNDRLAAFLAALAGAQQA